MLAMRVRLAIAMPLVLVQCQSERPVAALRFQTFVPATGALQVGSNFGYSTDWLWFPVQGIGCVAMREVGDETPSSSTTGWLVSLLSRPPVDSDVGEQVLVPAALASRICALGQLPPESLQVEQRALAVEGRKAGLFRIGMTEIERARGRWHEPR